MTQLKFTGDIARVHYRTEGFSSAPGGLVAIFDDQRSNTNKQRVLGIRATYALATKYSHLDPVLSTADMQNMIFWATQYEVLPKLETNLLSGYSNVLSEEVRVPSPFFTMGMATDPVEVQGAMSALLSQWKNVKGKPWNVAEVTEIAVNDPNYDIMQTYVGQSVPPVAAVLRPSWKPAEETQTILMPRKRASLPHLQNAA